MVNAFLGQVNDRKMSDLIDSSLQNALESGSVVLFVGSGIGRYARDDKGRQGPNGPELAAELAAEFEIETSDTSNLAKMAQLVELRHDRDKLIAFLSARLNNLEPNEVLQWLFSLRWRAIFTTNFDSLIERAYEIQTHPFQKPIPIALTSELTHCDPRIEVPLYYLHGSLDSPGKPELIITESDYARFRETRRMLFDLLKYHVATATILYVGYSHNDQNWQIIQTEIEQDFYPKPLPNSYRIAPGTPAEDIELLTARNVTTIDVSLDDFRKECGTAIDQQEIAEQTLEEIKRQIPPTLHGAYQKNPRITYDFFRSWEYVNDTPKNIEPNINEFLSGDYANWPLASNRIFFERDIEEEIFDHLLDFATMSSPSVKCCKLLSPAGYGTSTLLKALAARLVTEKAAHVFFSRSMQPVIERDVEFICSSVEGTKIFFIDNAAENAQYVSGIISRLKDHKLPACLVLGERLNEWRQRHAVIPGREFSLDPLSDAEIDRLLEFLEANNALGELEHLDDQLRFATVKNKHGKELLVVLREVIEDNTFDAIIEDEYRNISDDYSRKAYSAVCAFSRLRGLLRADALASIMQSPLEELYQRTRDSTEGVIIFECFDEVSGLYAARSRHPTIADIVWQRCLLKAETSELMMKALKSINLNFHLDVTAFENFIRNDSAVDSIDTFDAKTRYFETACKLAPTNPYVTQHYSRMLLREKRMELALAEINKAIEMRKDIRVLHHTKGTVLKEMAFSIDSTGLARKRLVQSEASFQKALALSPRDEYSFSSLAELYTGWAKRAPEEEETIDYLSKAEKVISEGMKKVRHRENLWIASAAIQDALGDSPKAIAALKRAVSENPKAVLPRYLLARYFLEVDEFAEILRVIRPVIEEHSEEYRSCMIYARAQLALGATLPEIIAIMNIGNLSGLKDPRYIAFLGGLYFLNGQFIEAENTFGPTLDQDFSAVEVRTIWFTAPDRSAESPSSKTYYGKVRLRKPGYAFITFEGYPDIFCQGTKFGDFVLDRGIEVEFEIGFSARGSTAINPRPPRIQN